MRKIWIAIVVLFGLNVQAQHTISGSFSPAEDFSWLIAYRLTPTAQSYIADTSITDGKFEMNIPENATPGVYRLVYAIPQDTFYFDVLFSNAEAVELQFDLETGVRFTTSEENQMFLSYFKEMNALESEVIAFYEENGTDKARFKALVSTWKKAQEDYEEKSKNTFVHTFVLANRPYFPQSFETKNQYIQHKKNRYFEHLNFSDPTLQASDFLGEKALNYIFTGHSVDSVAHKTQYTNALKENIAILAKRLNGASLPYQFSLFHKLWKQTTAKQLHQVADYILNTHLVVTAKSPDEKEIVNTIISENQLRIGNRAPEIEWVSGTETKRLSSSKTERYFLLVFWSSTCGHCLKEIPPLHDKLQQDSTISVIAIGLEEDEESWKNQSANLPDFQHAIALGKWESTYAKLYDIQKTPTYLILDKETRIVAKPDNAKAVLEFLKQ